jgi:hypothetical protein
MSFNQNAKNRSMGGGIDGSGRQKEKMDEKGKIDGEERWVVGGNRWRVGGK